MFFECVREQHRIASVSFILRHKQTVHARHVINSERRLIGAGFGGGTGCSGHLIEKAAHNLMRKKHTVRHARKERNQEIHDNDTRQPMLRMKCH